MIEGYIIKLTREDADVSYAFLDWSEGKTDFHCRPLPRMERTKVKVDAEFYEDEESAKETLRHLRAIGYVDNAEHGLITIGEVVEYTKQEEPNV